MKIPQTILFLLAFITTIHALALPASFESISDSAKELFKRKGGGGGGGRGGGGGSSSSSSSSSSSGSRGSGSSSSSSGSSSSGRTSSTSNTGGSTSKGSGPLPAYGSGRSYYAGGASVPYSSGTRRTGLGAPILLGAGVGALAYGAYAYPYGAFYYPYYHPWYYHNNTANRNETRPVACVCDQYSSCGCDDNNSTDYVNAVANNNTVSRVANINGTDTLVVNGTLPNGTTAPGGSDSAAAGLKMGMLQQAGYWPLIAGVAYTMWLM